METAWAMILAAGQGTRLAEATGGIAKQFIEWRGVPLYWHSARLFGRCVGIHGLIFVFPSDHLQEEHRRLESLFRQDDPGIPWKAVSGGVLRQDSVCKGLAALPESCKRVLIHDAARPFASAGLVHRILNALSLPGIHGAIPGNTVTDTIKIIEEYPHSMTDGFRQERVVATPERSTLRAVQTPQGFDVEVLRAAHAEALTNGWTVTDDASVLERAGRTVCVVPGDLENRKITSSEDLAMLQDAAVPCVGYGYDVHRFAKANESQSRPMRLGGVAIPGGASIVAHSDGDVLLHALMDALLGAGGLGDIGQHFPDSDVAFENINSAVLLDAVLDKTRSIGLRLTHVDLTVITQIPKIAPHRDSIRKNVARLLQLHLSHVNLKATTEEGLGFTGERLGIKAVALVTGTLEGR